MAALDGRFCRVRIIVAASGGDGNRDFLPLIGLERPSLEGVPFILVSLYEVDSLLMSPGDRLRLLAGDRRGRGGRTGHREKDEFLRAVEDRDYRL